MQKCRFDGVVFDLDGVITQTALVHSEAWKRMFDGYLRERAQKYGETFREFSHHHDYLPYVDGKPRYQGVASFLQSRGIQLPFGEPKDEPEQETVCALGNRKDIAFRKIVESEGVQPYPSTIALIKALGAHGVKIGVASSSKNCRLVLESSGLINLFATRVDGEVSAQLGLKGKPHPDIFQKACDNLGVAYDKAVIVEDAVSGVQAGRDGNFGLVVGIAREDNARALREHGADIVVNDLAEITLDEINRWFDEGLKEDGWRLGYCDYAAEKESLRETLLTVGNGYLGTRGAAEEMSSGGCHYPGTYIAGLYNRLSSKVAEKIVVNEDFVNIPNWLPITFKVDDGEFVDLDRMKLSSCDRSLDFKTGCYARSYLVEDQAGRRTRVESWRVASMDDPHVAALRFQLTPQNYGGKITIRAGLDGHIVNGNVARYKQLNAKHLDCVRQGVDGAAGHIVLRTNQSLVDIAEAMKLVIKRKGEQVAPKWRHEVDNGAIHHLFCCEVAAGETLVTDKIVAIHTSRDPAPGDPLVAACDKVKHYADFDAVRKPSACAWEKLWEKMDIKVEGDRHGQKLVRLHIFHTLATASPHNVGIDAGIPARGLHGEAYRGHIFWDELYILPLFNLHFPEVTKAVLMYRHRRLEKARAYAREYGYSGAMFPWQSGSDGSEETQVIHLNPLTGAWGDDYSSHQRHVSLAIALNVWRYWQATHDAPFLHEYGMEILLDISKFFVSMTELNPQSSRYEIMDVMGPDEYHEHHANSPKGGLKDNSYTNIMVAWLLKRTLEGWEMLPLKRKDELMQKLALSAQDFVLWREICRKLHLVVEDGIIAQFDGYFGLEELPWEEYRKKYANISRLDRILKAEGKTPDAYKVAKQADLLMTFFNLPKEEVADILSGLGYPPVSDLLPRNFAYYLSRTSHGSTLSKIVHAELACVMGESTLGWELYRDALCSDFNDVQGGTTGEGIHCGVMASTAYGAVSVYAGLDLRSGEIVFEPRLPAAWRSIQFGFQHRGDWFAVEVRHGSMTIRAVEIKEPRQLLVRGQKVTVKGGEERRVEF